MDGSELRDTLVLAALEVLFVIVLLAVCLTIVGMYWLAQANAQVDYNQQRRWLGIPPPEVQGL